MADRPSDALEHGLNPGLARGEPCPENARPYVLAATIIASAMAFIDSMLVSIALPTLQLEFGATIIDLQWVANGYALVLGALILVGGGLGDRVGRRRIFITGIVVFTVASVACAMAPSVKLLIAARGLQGLGAALLVPQSLALISANFPRDLRGKAIGTWAAASAATTAFGPPLGGFLIDLLSWRAAFWINVPLAAIAIWLTFAYVQESWNDTEAGPLDWPGAVVAVAGFGALAYGLTLLSDRAVAATTPLLWIGAGVAGIVAFSFVELRAQRPLMPLSLFRSRVFTGVNLVTVFIYGALAGFLFLVPFELAARRGMATAEAGLMLLPFGLIIGAASRYTGALADTYGPRPFLVGGSLLLALGCFGFTIGGANPWIAVLIPVLIISVGMALIVSPLTTAVMNSAPAERAGVASGINNTASRLSGVIAVAVIGALAGIVFSWNAPAGATFGIVPPVGSTARPAIEAAFVAGYNTAVIFATILCLLAAAISFVALAGTGPAKPTKVPPEPAES
ncbi:MAG: MFS transporter [Alphaproteobacteria bacterium]